MNGRLSTCVEVGSIPIGGAERCSSGNSALRKANMSTKNLARTVIEGGRSRYNKWERRYSHRQHRCRERAALTRLASTDYDDEDWVAPTRQRVYKQFSDKLGPSYRFLDSRCGKPWNDTHSLLMGCYDTRTTAGRHVLFCHILRDISYYFEDHDLSCAWWWSRPRYIVDRHGILRKVYRRRRFDADGVFPTSPTRPVAVCTGLALSKRVGFQPRPSVRFDSLEPCSLNRHRPFWRCCLG